MGGPFPANTQYQGRPNCRVLREKHGKLCPQQVSVENGHGNGNAFNGGLSSPISAFLTSKWPQGDPPYAPEQTRPGGNPRARPSGPGWPLHGPADIAQGRY